ncbi:tropomyosin-like isoform X1 [Hibiscus syriacus]|uniref:Tropomyosin-like isoform X1 n=1 Tax=Hibiscus syriacus TaxID=106335 RepID=A0A6A2XA05_HIBSY|nr:LYR motif-containing protein 4-like [Hibiscus syriacus]KAE8655209.1 tropomyosin-like isoform X1 [Hibiscus syriacus]
MAVPGAVVPMRIEVLHLYRTLLRVGRQFSDYNIGEYSKRRTMDAFRDNKNLTDTRLLSAAFSDGKAQLEVAKKQAIVYSLYAPKVKSILDF